jgi:hypothetical protein
MRHNVADMHETWKEQSPCSTHNSHYTRAFLEYTHKHHIHVACYPAHTAHVYQLGLDVVVFVVLKRYWSEERDKWERERGERITKANFITIYGRTHLRAPMPGPIRTTFRKTGVWPFNRDVVSDSIMVLSKETSKKSHLPIMPSTPLRVITDFFRRPQSVSTESKDTEDVEDVGNTEDVAESTEPVTAVSGTITQAATALDDVITKLAETSLSSLVDTSAARSEMMLQHGISHPIFPIKKSPDPTIADLIPTT